MKRKPDTGELRETVIHLAQRDTAEIQIIQIVLELIKSSGELETIFYMTLQAYELFSDQKLLPLNEQEEDKLRFRVRELNSKLRPDQINSIIKKIKRIKPGIVGIIKKHKIGSDIPLEKILEEYWNEYGIEDLLEES